MEIGATLEVDSAEGFAEWLAANGEHKEIWVVIYNKSSGKQTVTYQKFVDVALCYGWIDGISKGIDAEKHAQRFSPRRKKSNWTETNKAISRRLIAEGRMTAAGQAALPEDMRS